jgi:hypothetical protein
MTAKDINISWNDVDTAQDASRALLTIAGSHPPNIGMGALIMATSVAAREMNLPLESIAAMFDRTLAEVYATAERAGLGKTVN